MEDSGADRLVAPVEVLSRAWGLDAGARRALAVMWLIAGTLLALWPTTQTLIARWSDGVSRAYTHGALVLLLCGFMAWRRRAQLAAVVVAPSWLAFGVAIALGAAWLVAYRSGIEIAHQALVPLIVFALAWAMFGFALARRALLPIGYLFFAIPVWDALVPSLQWASTFAVREMLNLVGIPVFFDGLAFQIPAGRFEIEQGCSGLHFFIVGLAIATFYGELHRDTARTRIKLLVYAALAALLTNWIRIAIIIVAGHFTDMQHYLVSGEHYSFGWAMFAVAMAIYFLVVRRWPANEAIDVAPAPGPRHGAVPVPGIALAGLALLAPALPVWLDANAAPESELAAHALPESVSGWQSRAESFAFPPRFSNADAVASRAFVARGATVQAIAATYREQLQGKELGNFANEPFGERFRALRAAPTGSGWLAVEARDHRGARWLVYVRYRVGERFFLDTRRAQIFYGITSQWSDPLSSAYVLRVPCDDDCSAARATLDQFVARLAPP